MRKLNPAKMLGPGELVDAIEEITSVSPDVVLVGGVALLAYGSPRMTADIDVLAQRPVPPRWPVHGTLAFGGWRIRTSQGVQVDWIDRSDGFEAVYDEALLDGGRYVPEWDAYVAELEYLVLMKMIAGRPKDDLDLIWLLQRLDDADIEDAREAAQRLLGPYALKDLDARIQEAAWHASKEES